MKLASTFTCLEMVHTRQVSSAYGFTKTAVISSRKSSTKAIPCHDDQVQPFEDIPVVKGLPFIGSLLDYTRLKGFGPSSYAKHFQNRHKEYGDIYRESLLGSQMVVCRTQRDTEAIFRNDGRVPIRPETPGVTKIREMVNLKDSIVNMQGEEWYKFRKVMNPLLLQNKRVWTYIREQQIVAKELVRYIEHNMNEQGEVPEFANALDKWAFEMSGVFVLNTHFGLLTGETDPEMQKVIDGTSRFLKFIADSQRKFPWWRFFDTKDAKETAQMQKEALDVISLILSKAVADKEKVPLFLESVQDSKILTEKDKELLLFDVMSAAIETTSRGAALVMYCLTLDLKCQEKLRAEIMELPEILNGRAVDNMSYMNAFIKEAMRMFPLVSGFGRRYKDDIVLSGYRIPAGTVVISSSNSTENRNPVFFPEPDSFIPERWMKSQRKNGTPDQRFILTGSFGIGARACPGRRFAMQEIRLMLIEVLKKYRVEYHHKPIVAAYEPTGGPSEEPRFTFVPLDL